VNGKNLTIRVVRVEDSRPAASVDFSPGLNVITGASDTGKTYICQTIDFLFGASSPPEPNPASAGYTRALLGIETRQHNIAIMRAFQDDNVRLFESDFSNLTSATSRTLRAIHRTGDNDTLSYYLLSAVGLDGKSIRRNAKGDKASLTFRHVSHLILINEERIISRFSPALTGQYVKTTEEKSAFAFFITGSDDTDLLAPATQRDGRARLEAEESVLRTLVSDKEDRLRSILDAASPAARSDANLDEQIEDATEVIAATQSEIERLEEERLEQWETLQKGKSRQLFLDEQLKRLHLLQEFYTADTERLTAVLEAGAAFEQLPGGVCAACGSKSEYRDEAVLSETLASFRVSCTEELRKIHALSTDVHVAVSEMNAERESLIFQESRINALLAAIDRQLQEKLNPERTRVDAGIARLIQLKSERIRIDDLQNEIKDLNRRLAQIQSTLNIRPARRKSGSRLETTMTAGFCEVVESLLLAWKFPLRGNVTFDPQRFDLVLGDQNRGSLGKGYRALTHAAFTIGLMRYCRQAQIPHPGLVVLDTPLNPLRGPDEGNDGQVNDEIKNSFFEDLAQDPSGDQVIILENTEPPDHVKQQIHYHHFTKNPNFGRYGFFPV